MNIVSRISRLFAACVGLVAASLVIATPAQASTEIIFSSESSATTAYPDGRLCIDVSYASTANGTAIKQWPCDGGPAQRWTARRGAERDGYVYYQLISSLSSADEPKCLDLPWGNPIAGNALWQWPCNNTAAQQWNWRYV